MLKLIQADKSKYINQCVKLSGFVAKIRNLGSKVFLDLRNSNGFIQLVVENPLKNTNLLKIESYIKIKGIVKYRKSVNFNTLLGDIEVLVEDNNIQIVSIAQTPPMIISDNTDALEVIRAKYRYLDLRRPVLLHNLKVRSEVKHIISNFLYERDFLDIETPILTKSTPEGARDFVIPSRNYKDLYYALPQSPQIYKQLLMVAGIEKYFQIARCFRDEDLRKDRQFEFTQLDIEIANIVEEDVYRLIEELLFVIFEKIKGINISKSFPRITYYDAINLYGSDKPDTRFALKLVDLGNILKGINILNDNETIKAIFLDDSINLTNKDIKKLSEISKTYKLDCLYTLKYTKKDFHTGISKFLDSNMKEKLRQILPNPNADYLILIGAGNWLQTCTALGYLRSYIGKNKNLYNDDEFSFNWIIDWPLFKYDSQENRYCSIHHPFTSFKDEHEIYFKNKQYNKIISRAYDIVVNGYELGGGSIRITNPNFQKEVMRVLGIHDKVIEEKFGQMIEAYKYGSPSHGGIALGIDRLIMILTSTELISDVVAFPKTLTGKELMLDTPSKIDF